jgi:hypothetical protein
METTSPVLGPFGKMVTRSAALRRSSLSPFVWRPRDSRKRYAGGPGTGTAVGGASCWCNVSSATPVGSTFVSSVSGFHPSARGARYIADSLAAAIIGNGRNHLH